VIIGSMRNWGRVALEWNMANDASYNPHTPGGCTECKGALTIDGAVSRNVSYYIIAHASKFVTPGSVVISSTIPMNNLPNVAFKTPEGKILYYNGVATIKQKTVLAKEKASGIMIWQLQGDAPGKHSLLDAINKVANEKE